MSVLINFLERLNRKERYFVMAHATGVRDLSIGDEFRRQLSAAIGVEVPASARLFMDYHLDWLVASLHLAFDQPARLFFKNAGQEVKGNQEDLDLLVAFEDRAVTRLVMVEAKAATAWSSAQLRSKVDRLKKIFPSEQVWSPHVTPHFLLLSPAHPSQEILKLARSLEMPTEGDPWVQLKFPAERLVVERTMADGRPSKTGRHYLVHSESKAQRRAA
jgi:hypothetical protein